MEPATERRNKVGIDDERGNIRDTLDVKNVRRRSSLSWKIKLPYMPLASTRGPRHQL